MIFGGVSQVPQVAKLTMGVDILIATPGRLLDLMGQRRVNLQNVKYFVLDEADRMLDMGFLHDVEKVIAQLPKERQTMLFSATMPAAIEKLTKTLLVDPVKVAVAPVSSTVDTVEQSVYFVNKQNKIDLLIHLLKDRTVVSALVFSRTKHGADKIARKLTQSGISADVIHSNKSQNARQAALGRFKDGQARVLVATDIVARGIDIDELSHVINFDLPEVPEAYVHRIGRTARAGLGGTAISFCDETEKKLLREIEKLINKQVPVVNDHPYPLVAMASLPAQPQQARGGFRQSSQPGRTAPRSPRQPMSRQSAKPVSRAAAKPVSRPAAKPVSRQPQKPQGPSPYNIHSEPKNSENKSKYNI